MEFNQLAQTVVNGLMFGGILCIVAIGFSLVWGIMHVVNLAHGAFIMLGAYVTFFCYTVLGIDPFISIPISMAVLFALGWLCERYIIHWVIRGPQLARFFITFGLALLIENLATNFFTGDIRAVNPSYGSGGFDLGGVRVPIVKLAALGLSIALALAFNAFLTRTKTGNSIRATGMDLDAARLTGVRVASMYAVTFAISTALAGAAGSLISMTASFTPDIGPRYTVYAFLVSVLGGLGSVPAVIAGGLLLGLVRAFAGLLSPGLSDAIAFVLLVLLLFVRPQGLFGKAFNTGKAE